MIAPRWLIRNRVSSLVSSIAIALWVVSSSLTVHAQDGADGTVQIPLATWQRLGQSNVARAELGVATVQAQIEERGERLVAVAHATIEARSRGEGAIAVILPPGAVVTATRPATPLLAGPEGLIWRLEVAGAQRLAFDYEVDVQRGDSGASVALPLPLTSSVQLSVTLPTDAVDGSMIPGVGLRTSRDHGALQLSATLAGGALAHIAWRAADGAEQAVAPSRATYRGLLADDQIAFTAELVVDLIRDATITLPIFPTYLAIGDVTVDGADAALRITDSDYVGVVISGRGRHTVRASFTLPVDRARGLPGVLVPVPQVPVSQFEISMPAGKDVRVEPNVAIRHERRRDLNVATFNVPITDEVRLQWPEALPDEPNAAQEQAIEVRASATLVHVVQPEEGLLRGRLHASWIVSRGASSQFELAVPAGVDIGQVTTLAATVSDWRTSGESERRLTIFLDREVSGPIDFTIDYEVLRRGDSGAEPVELPLLSSLGTARQNGMLALLMTRDLALDPQSTEGIARVGENQLPREVRESITATVGHVYRWTDSPPAILAAVIARPREAARFDARIDSLVSVGDVTTGVSAAIDIHVKSGTLAELQIALPAETSVLEVSAPSLREHRVSTENGQSRVELFFTQEMDGQVRVELRYERIVAAGETVVSPPLAHVVGADVEQGRIAVEATAAVEVDAQTAEGLSPIDLGELPEELVLRSENPILQAFRYAHVTPPPSLTLSVQRHQEVSLPEAAIDLATYQTVVIDDELAVTTATWMVRNQSQQFLRITLPASSALSSARVAGRSETPARSGDGEDGAILIGVLRSLEPFEVQITYTTPIHRLSLFGLLGRLSLELPRPDVAASRAQWEIYLPSELEWGEPTSSLEVKENGVRIFSGDGVTPTQSEGLHIVAPRQGRLYLLEGLFVGRDDQVVMATFPFTSKWGSVIGWLLGVIGAIMAWLGLLGLIMARAGIALVPEGGPFELATYRFATSARTMAVSNTGFASLVALILIGFAISVLSIVWLGASIEAPVVTSILVLLGITVALRRMMSERLASWVARLRPTRTDGAPRSPIPPPDFAPSPQQPRDGGTSDQHGHVAAGEPSRGWTHAGSDANDPRHAGSGRDPGAPPNDDPPPL